jgi:hypothetical protein
MALFDRLRRGASALFGWFREKGTRRSYVGPTGERLSRRQYDKLVAAAGGRKSKGAITTAARDAAEARVKELASKRRPSKRAVARATVERDALRAAHGKHWAAQAGQRRYNTALELYVRRERRAGRTMSKRTARSSDEFKAIMAAYKPEKPRKRESPDARRARQKRNEARREEALRLLGDRHGEEFREIYKELDISVLHDDEDEEDEE